MNKAFYLLFAAAIMGLAACAKNNDQSKGTDDKKISLNTSIQSGEPCKTPSLNQDGEGDFSAGDQFLLLVSNAGNKYDSFTYTVGKTQLYWNDLTVADEGAVDFSACYPVQETSDGIFVFDVNASSDPDLLIAQCKGVAVNEEKPVNLVFRHGMHRLKVKFNVEDGIEAGDIVTKCNAESVCSVNLTEGTVSAETGNKAVFSRQGQEVEFVIVPQKTSDVTLQISVGETEKTVAVNELKPEIDELRSGMQLCVELTVRNGKIEIGNVAIEGWENQGTIGGEIIL